FNGNGFGPGTAAGTYNLAAGHLTSNAGESIGEHGSGTFLQTGGSNVTIGTAVVGNTAAATGFYSLSGGSVTFGSITVGNFGSGTYFQDGGTSLINGMMSVAAGSASIGAYSMSAGSLNVYGESDIGLGGAATFSQTGGIHTVGRDFSPSPFVLGANSTETGYYSLSAGSF